MKAVLAALDEDGDGTVDKNEFFRFVRTDKDARREMRYVAATGHGQDTFSRHVPNLYPPPGVTHKRLTSLYRNFTVAHRIAPRFAGMWTWTR